MLQQIDISAPEDFNLVSPQNRSNHSRRGAVLAATSVPRLNVGVTLAGAAIWLWRVMKWGFLSILLCHWTCFGQQIWKNEQPLKREGTFEGQMSHIRPQVIVLFNPQSHSVVLMLCQAVHVWSNDVVVFAPISAKGIFVGFKDEVRIGVMVRG